MEITERKKTMETGEKSNIYEVGYLVAPNVSEGEIAGEVSFIRELLKSAGALLITEEVPKLRPLAYVMEKPSESKKQKFSEGYFGWIKFESPAVSISNIKQGLDKRQSIIRHLIIKTVRENTMYSSRLVGPQVKGDDKLPEESPAKTHVENKAVAEKGIDQSIDALVIG